MSPHMDKHEMMTHKMQHKAKQRCLFANVMKNSVGIDIAWAGNERKHTKWATKDKDNPFANVIRIFHYENDVTSMD